MRVIRRPAYQGHDIPQTAHQPRGPFPPELFVAGPLASVEPEDIDTRENAQNNYRAPALMRCTLCGEVMTEDETDAHRCG